MNWAVLIVSLIVVLFVVGAVRANRNIRTAEDNWDVVVLMAGVGLFGVIDFILIIIWLAIT